MTSGNRDTNTAGQLRFCS